jgi:hypothetical protein
MFSQKNGNGLWRELGHRELEQVCGGHDKPQDYDPINEQPEEPSTEDEEPTLYRVLPV